MKRHIFIAIMLLIAPFITHSQGNVHIIGFDVKDCDSISLRANIRTRIIEKKFEKDIFLLTIGINETCCRTFTPVVKYEPGKKNSHDTLYVGYQGGGNECECDCYYEFTYRIKGLKNAVFEMRFKGKPIEFSTEKYVTFPVEYKVMGNDTINFVDKYGFRQGIWTFDSVRIKKYYLFKDDVHRQEVTRYDDGTIQRLVKREFDNWNYLVEYHESGQKKLECYNGEIGGSYTEGKCKEWAIDGHLIYEGPYKKQHKP